VLRAVVLTQYRRVTDGRTDGQTVGIVVASTTLAMRRAVKKLNTVSLKLITHTPVTAMFEMFAFTSTQIVPAV